MNNIGRTEKESPKTIPSSHEKQFSDLPALVLENIFSRLSTWDLQKAILVCSNWKAEALYVRKLQRLRNREALYQIHQETDSVRKQVALRRMSKELAAKGDVRKAVKVAMEIEIDGKKECRANTMQQIALVLIDKAHPEQAIKVADLITRSGSRCSTLVSISFRLSSARNFKRALEVAKMIPPPTRVQINSWREDALEQIRESLAKTAEENFEQAIEAVHTISDTAFQQCALSAISKRFSFANQLGRALIVAKMISEARPRDDALIQIFRKYADEGSFDLATEIAQMIFDTYIKGTAFGELTKKLASAGRLDEARKYALLISATGDKDSTLNYISRRFLAAHQYEKSLEVSAMISHTELRDSTLVEISLCLAKLEATDSFEQAVNAVNMITSAEAKQETLIEISIILAAAGRSEQTVKAVLLLSEARKKAKAAARWRC